MNAVTMNEVTIDSNQKQLLKLFLTHFDFKCEFISIPTIPLKTAFDPTNNCHRGFLSSRSIFAATAFSSFKEKPKQTQIENPNL